MGVPTIAMSYSHKFEGVLAAVIGDRKYIIDVRGPNLDQLLQQLCCAFDSAWAGRGKLAEALLKNIEPVKKKSLENAELVRKLADN